MDLKVITYCILVVMERDPCPWRLIDDAGGGFTIGKQYIFLKNSFFDDIMFVKSCTDDGNVMQTDRHVTTARARARAHAHRGFCSYSNKDFNFLSFLKGVRFCQV